jgi:hypothetical protein
MSFSESKFILTLIEYKPESQISLPSLQETNNLFFKEDFCVKIHRNCSLSEQLRVLFSMCKILSFLKKSPKTRSSIYLKLLNPKN